MTRRQRSPCRRRRRLRSVPICRIATVHEDRHICTSPRATFTRSSSSSGRNPNRSANRYRARATRAELTAELMHETLGDFGERDRGSALVAFVADASPDEVEALRRALDALE